MPSPRWPSARAASFGPRAAGRGEYGCGERTATPYIWPCRRTRMRSGPSPLVRTNGGIDCLAFAPDGDVLASGGHDATMRLWEASLGTPLQDVPHPGPIAPLA